MRRIVISTQNTLLSSMFVCTAEPQAGGTLSYQWYRDGKAIPAETYSYYSFTPFVVDANREYDEELNGTYGVFSCRVTESTSGLTTEAKAQAYFSSKKPEPLTMTFEFWTPGVTYSERDSEKVTREYIINNANIISVTPAALPDAKLNTEYSQQLTAKDVSGNTLDGVTFTCTQGLPYGIEMSKSGLISGTATGLNNLGENHVFFNVSKEDYTTEYCALTLNVYDKDAVSAHANGVIDVTDK